MNQDCIVNLKDLAIIAGHWLECTKSIVKNTCFE